MAIMAKILLFFIIFTYLTISGYSGITLRVNAGNIDRAVKILESVTPFYPDVMIDKILMDAILVGDAAAFCNPGLEAEVVGAMVFLRSAQIFTLSVVFFSFEKKGGIAPAPFYLPHRDFYTEHRTGLTPGAMAGVVIGTFVAGGALTQGVGYLLRSI